MKAPATAREVSRTPKGRLFTGLPVALALSTCDSGEEPIHSAPLIGRYAGRPANEGERRGRDGEIDTARAERAAALDRAGSRGLVADTVCSHRKLGRAAG